MTPPIGLYYNASIVLTFVMFFERITWTPFLFKLTFRFAFE